MRLLADESIDRQIVERLRLDGHEVSYIAEIASGIADHEVLEHANKTSALLLTADNDFGELVYRKGHLNSGGVVLIRLAGLSAWGKAEITANAFRVRGADFPDCFSIMRRAKSEFADAVNVPTLLSRS